MKKSIYSLICFCSLISTLLCACGTQQSGTAVKDGSIMDSSEEGDNTAVFQSAAQEPSVVKTYEVSAPTEESAGDDDFVILVRHYELSDGSWKTDTHTYQYRLEITGSLGGNAAKDSTFVFLSNLEDITFEQAWKASGLSSNMNDYFKEEDAKYVAIK